MQKELMSQATVTGKKIICLNIVFTEQVHSFFWGTQYHFVSIALKEPAGAINSPEHPSIQLNNQWGGKKPSSITVVSLN